MEKRVVEAVIEELKCHGFKFTMDDVTARLHMSKSSLYKLVGSKDNLVHGVLEYIKADFVQRRQALWAENVDIHTKLQGFMELYLRIFKHYNNMIYQEIKQLYYAEWEDWIAFQQDNIDSLLALLQQGIDSGEFRPVNVHLVRQVILSSMTALTDYEFLQENNMTYYDALEGLGDILFNGLKK